MIFDLRRPDRPHRTASGRRRGAFYPPAYFSSRTPHRPPAHSTAAGMLIKSRPRERYVYVSIRRIYWAVSATCSEHCREKESISRFMPIYEIFIAQPPFYASDFYHRYIFFFFLRSRKTRQTATKLRGKNICPATVTHENRRDIAVKYIPRVLQIWLQCANVSKLTKISRQIYIITFKNCIRCYYIRMLFFALMTDFITDYRAPLQITSLHF